ncbi:hypothetical protein [Streptacidiphilus sp. PAMC 29251]
MTQHSDLDEAVERLTAFAARTREIHQAAEADVPEALRTIAARVRQARARAAGNRYPRNEARDLLDEAARTTLSAPGAMAVLVGFAHEQEPPGRRQQPFTGSHLDLDLQIEGALLFGCLLHLSAHPISASFWWKVAAGAGNRTAATCLYLHRVLRGDSREAFWWLTQAIALAKPHNPPPTLPAISGWPQILPHLLPAPGPVRSTPVPFAQLACELDRLVVRPGPDPDNDDPAIDVDGIAACPGPSFTRRLEQALA